VTVSSEGILGRKMNWLENSQSPCFYFAIKCFFTRTNVHMIAYFNNYNQNKQSFTIGAEDATFVGGCQGYIYIGDYVDTASDTTPPALSDVLITDYEGKGIKVTALVSDDLSGIGKVALEH